MAAPTERRREGGAGRAGFSLPELLVAMTLLTLLTTLLVGLNNQISKGWLQTQSQIQRRQSARSLFGFMERDLAMAVLPIAETRSAAPAGTQAQSLQFVIDPDLGAAYNHRDSLFWQAPVAADASRGDLAEVGYFVRWEGTTALLCRLLVNPTDTANYKIYGASLWSDWLSPGLLDALAPGTAAGTRKYLGLFAENVLALWAQPYDADGVALALPYDSRASRKLPASVDISLVVLDDTTAKRITSRTALQVQGLYGKATAQEFMAALPAELRQGAACFATRVYLRNSQ